MSEPPHGDSTPSKWTSRFARINAKSITVFCGVIAAISVTIGKVYGTFDQIMADYSSSCYWIKDYPNGTWFLSEITTRRIPAQEYSSESRYDTPESGVWMSGDGNMQSNGQYKTYSWQPFYVDRQLVPGRSITLRETHTYDSYVFEAKVKISSDGCKAIGTFTSTFNNVQTDFGHVEYCYALLGKDCKAFPSLSPE